MSFSRYSSLLLGLALLPGLAHAALYITIVQGLSGTDEYQQQFDATREKIGKASAAMTATDKLFTFNGDDATREKLLAHFAALDKKMGADDRAAIYLIGHGSFDGSEYKFNIPGPDLTGADFKNILDKLPGHNHLLVNTSSTSGAMIQAITGDKTDSGYILVAATRNGNERNATQFGNFFADALTSADADINKNNNISLQEAYDYADRNVADFFKSAGKLATEHAQMSGEGAAQFTVARLKQEVLPADNKSLSDLIGQRQGVADKIEDLQLRRNELSNADYIQQLQALVLQSAELGEKIDAEQAGAGGDNKQ